MNVERGWLKIWGLQLIGCVEVHLACLEGRAGKHVHVLAEANEEGGSKGVLDRSC